MQRQHLDLVPGVAGAWTLHLSHLEHVGRVTEPLLSGAMGLCELSIRSELLGQGWDRPPQHRALPWPVVWGGAGSASEGPTHKPQGTGDLLSCSPAARSRQLPKLRCRDTKRLLASL